jgi:segregation and condensation protein B
MMSDTQLREIIESLLFTANRALESEELAKLICKGGAAAAEEGGDPALAAVTPQDIDHAVEQLQQRLEGTAVMIQSVSKGYRMATRPEYEFWAALPYETNVKPSRLSQPALETLAVIAYRQPISRAEIEAVRGVAVGGVLETLVDRGVVLVAGRADVPGRPLLYETTPYFLEHFGLKELEDLPNSEELKRVPLPQPPDPDGESQQELIEADVPVESGEPDVATSWQNKDTGSDLESHANENENADTGLSSDSAAESSEPAADSGAEVSEMVPATTELAADSDDTEPEENNKQNEPSENS